MKTTRDNHIEAGVWQVTGLDAGGRGIYLRLMQDQTGEYSLDLRYCVPKPRGLTPTKFGQFYNPSQVRSLLEALDQAHTMGLPRLLAAVDGED